MKKVQDKDDHIGSVALLTAAMFAAGLGIVSARPSRCAGARRSVRLQFEQRQTEIDAQISKNEISKSAPKLEVPEDHVDER